MHADPRDRPTDAWIESLRSRYPTERYVDRALTRKLQARANAAYQPQTTLGLEARLHRLLDSRLDGDFQISDIRPLTGGASKEQFSFRLTRPGRDGRSHTEKLVLRMSPGASAAETHRLREFQLMGALQGTLPIPEPRWIDPEGEVFGQPCLICSFCEGIARPPAEGGSAMQMFYGRTYRQALAPQFIAHLAALAHFDWSRHDLSSFDPPQPGTCDGVIQQLNWWQRVWAEDAVCADPLITLVGRWLRAHAPIIDKVSVVHADYRAGNFLFSPDTKKITVILDWELAFLGDRHRPRQFDSAALFRTGRERQDPHLRAMFSRGVFASL
jgi:aminoglycoside phosphotransferase (APT) family kinase protein